MTSNTFQRQRKLFPSKKRNFSSQKKIPSEKQLHRPGGKSSKTAKSTGDYRFTRILIDDKNSPRKSSHLRESHKNMKKSQDLTRK